MAEYVKKCKYCGKEFVTANSKKLYCCNNCKASEYRDRHRNKVIKVCPVCGKEFVANRSIDVYCSKECYKISKIDYGRVRRVIKEPIKRTCPICGKEFIAKVVNAKYCSPSCRYKGKRLAHIEKCRERSRVYYTKNKQKYKEWEERNREKRKVQKRNYYFAHKEEKKKYAEINKDRIRENKRKLHHENMKKDPNYRLMRICRGFVRRCLENKKSDRTQNILGYTPVDLRNHLETLFYNGMSWDNYSDWEGHHIKPLDTFNFINEDGTDNYDTIRDANKLDNLVPLFIEDHKALTSLYNTEKKWLNLEEIQSLIRNEDKHA